VPTIYKWPKVSMGEKKTSLVVLLYMKNMRAHELYFSSDVVSAKYTGHSRSSPSSTLYREIEIIGSGKKRKSMDNRLLRPEEAAKVLGISKSFVYTLVRRGELNAVRIRTTVRIRQADLDQFIATNLIHKDAAHLPSTQ